MRRQLSRFLDRHHSTNVGGIDVLLAVDRDYSVSMQYDSGIHSTVRHLKPPEWLPRASIYADNVATSRATIENSTTIR